MSCNALKGRDNNNNNNNNNNNETLKQYKNNNKIYIMYVLQFHVDDIIYDIKDGHVDFVPALEIANVYFHQNDITYDMDGAMKSDALTMCNIMHVLCARLIWLCVSNARITDNIEQDLLLTYSVCTTVYAFQHMYIFVGVNSRTLHINIQNGMRTHSLHVLSCDQINKSASRTVPLPTKEKRKVKKQKKEEEENSNWKRHMRIFDMGNL
uniref:Uncharacterized protein n=1 Tax=Glossina austeni TaxID=7395 RepID=A0A1A9UV06_GLOAU